MLAVKTREMVESIEEYMEQMKSELFEDIEDMSMEEFKNYQFLMKLLGQSTELLVAQADALDSMNEKLDRLLERE